MGRIAEPWRWEARKAWYAGIWGVRVRLASFSEGKRAAQRRLAELLAEADAPEREEVPTVGRLVLEYLAHLRCRRERGGVALQTKGDAERRMAGFAALHGDLAADSVRPKHLDEWLATKLGSHPRIS